METQTTMQWKRLWSGGGHCSDILLAVKLSKLNVTQLEKSHQEGIDNNVQLFIKFISYNNDHFPHAIELLALYITNHGPAVPNQLLKSTCLFI